MPHSRKAVEILYSDTSDSKIGILAIYKPAGIPSAPHASRPTEDSALTRALLQFPELAETPGLRPWEPALLHRLDTGTSGVLLLARTPEAFAQFRSQWKSLRKTYRAWVSPQTLEASQVIKSLTSELPSPRVIEFPLGHSAKSSKRMLAQTAEITPAQFERMIRGRPYPSHTELILVHDECDGAFDIEVRIQTGVMHQIRAHLASIGLPIVGDPIYGPISKRDHAQEDPTALQLHAWRVEIPGLGRIEAPLDATHGRGLWNTKK